ncbi:MAG: ABC transporter permease [Chloroflexi bacterium]|nr:ABC transporter permease [Chloroflexota bacterium]
MSHYIARRLLMAIPTLIGVSLIIFAIMRIMPGDVAIMVLGGGGFADIKEEDLIALRRELGTDRPLHEQYLSWVGGLVRGDLGKSLKTHEPIGDMVRDRLPLSVELSLLATLVSSLIAIPLGIACAVRQDSWVDYILRVFSIIGLAMPIFWTGVMILLGMALFFNRTPPLGFASLFEDPVKNLQQLVWPAVAMGYFNVAAVSRMTRSCMLEVMRQDYIRTAWSKGLRELLIISRHALKNAMLPVVTLVGIQFAHLMGGAVIMETVFSLPGMGRALIDAIIYRDYTVVQSIIVVFAFIILMANLVVDLLYGQLDPRIRYQ